MLVALVQRIEHAVVRGESPAEPLDLDDVYQVQLAKTLDISVYVDERLVKGVVSLEDKSNAA